MELPDIKVSEHFGLLEFCRTNHTAYQKENYDLALKNIDRIKALAQDLEIVRARFERPVVITCGARSQAVNLLVCGSPTSQHTKAEAVDFLMPKMDLREVFEWIVRASGLSYGQVIHETKGPKVWIHYSLGEPYREKEKCRMALTFNGDRYQRYA